jgi:multidrug efflux pump subunit AcrB
LTTIVVFLPIIYVHGVAGQLFKDTALTVTFALISSLFVSLTLLPTLQARQFRPGELPTGKGKGFRLHGRRNQASASFWPPSWHPLILGAV